MHGCARMGECKRKDVSILGCVVMRQTVKPEMLLNEFAANLKKLQLMLAGKVFLLTTPISAGYSQNPISVYYCLEGAGNLIVCIAEVTNTPWGATVTFLFRPDGQQVPKAMHVSPFMDMRSTW